MPFTGKFIKQHVYLARMICCCCRWRTMKRVR